MWKSTLKEFIEKDQKKISDNREEMEKLGQAADKIDKDVDANIIFKNFPSETVMPAPLNTILDLEQFQFPVAPTVASPPLSPGGKTRKLSEAVCLLSDAEKEERMKLLKKADDFVVLKDGRVYKVAIVSEDFEGE